MYFAYYNHLGKLFEYENIESLKMLIDSMRIDNISDDCILDFIHKESYKFEINF